MREEREGELGCETARDDPVCIDENDFCRVSRAPQTEQSLVFTFVQCCTGRYRWRSV